ncbi:protein adenylyltransferase FICD-like [Dysidea avara]|uniref:protein adenylyltransferase FICD-like n=1 Tax=Dysidea avara TaxID=196820 RepID=UPI00332AFAED
MEYIGSVKFDLVDLESWTTASSTNGHMGRPSISQLVEEIVAFKKRYDDLSPYARSQFRSVLDEMTVEFVYKTNIGESVGIVSEDGTREVISDYRNHGVNQVKENNERTETVNVYRALEYVSELREEMEKTGKVTVQQICEIHRVLMHGLREDAGEIRKHDVYTLSGKGREVHFYPESVIAEQIFYACVDHHCIQMSQFTSGTLSAKTIEFIFKRAARLLFDFVDAHPFGDGNGRTCRLLANYVISLITPFPVAPSYGQGEEIKNNYLKAIIECRDHRDKGPGALASMLIEDTWRGWKRLFESIDHNIRD